MKKNNLLFLLLLFVFSIPSIFALFHKGFFPTDDGEWMVIRFSAFHQALTSGQFPVRFLPRLYFEYGYPVANFLYPGFMYLGEVFKLLHFGFVDTIKIIFGLSMVSSGIFIFLWLSKLFDRTSSFISALIYLYAPYHLYDLYKRGSVGEVLALSVLPFVMWQVERDSILWMSLGIAFLILSHNTLALLFIPVVVIYMMLKGFKRIHLLSLLLGFGISAFFWIPALLDLPSTQFSKTSVSEWRNYFVGPQLLGYSTILIAGLFIIMFLSKKVKFNKNRMAGFFFLAGLISLFFATSLSSAFWNILPVSFIQFPFRFISVVLVCFSFLAANVLNTFDSNKKIVAGAIFLLLTIFSAKQYLGPSEFFDKGDSYYATNEDSTTVKNEYLPKWVLEKPTMRAASKIEIENGLATKLIETPKKYSLDVVSDGNAMVTINTFYFPGWDALVDGKISPIKEDPSTGVMQVSVPKGKHSVNVTFGETPLRLLTDAISIFSFICLILFLKKRTLKL